jgi:hypothetical protein
LIGDLIQSGGHGQIDGVGAGGPIEGQDGDVAIAVQKDGLIAHVMPRSLRLAVAGG